MQTHWTDGHIVLRPFEPGDVEAFHEAAHASAKEVGRWLDWCHADYALEEAKTWVQSRPAAWEAGEAYSFGVFDAGTGDFLGGCGLNTLHPVHHFANLGYWVRSAASRRGVATRAVRLCATFGFSELESSPRR